MKAVKFGLIGNFIKRPFQEQYVFRFENGYGASVIRGKYTYGGSKGLWELAVLDSYGNLCYDTEITNDVIGHLSDDEVESILEKIRGLVVGY